ncbi:glycerophosphodiester phosphodiesterase family protein [Martelella sp. HB161492]|uniref:glycerophosphodiester phosphodiesterase n=1 Tax=Martelella sp. HB161492 TaxID=2720726 RepID=UPI0015928CF7|nr:glycerophosphodiester phosphodiesterase family protein [Martelella sp. HB161492]
MTARLPVFKWHRLRQRLDDCAFDRSGLWAGLAHGASMEVDLRALGDGGFVCLHDATLDRETDGSGSVRSRTTKDIETLSMLGDKGAPTWSPPMTLGELCEAVRASKPVSRTRIQLDFKDRIDSLEQAHFDHFRECLAGIAGYFVLSGDDAMGLQRLGGGLEGLTIGYDPCTDDTLAALNASGRFAEFAADAVAAAPFAGYIYLEYPIILAGLKRGINLARLFQAEGKTVDAYTLNATHPEASQSLATLVAVGVDQITTDEPAVMAAMLAGLSRQTG